MDQVIEATQTAAQAEPSPLTPPAAGAAWPSQGGIYLGIIPAMFGMPPRHLIVAAEFADLQWGPYGKKVEGADSHHDGRANTAALVSAKTGHPAAQWAANLRTGGFDDWFLPSRMELLYAFYAGKAAFDEDYWHWTSTQAGANCAFAQDFRYGLSFWLVKVHDFRVRAFRTIHVTP